MDTQAAVDGLQYYAERSGLTVELGQDRVQDILAAAFIWAREVVDAEVSDECDDALGSGYAADIVRQWELADPRDRWRHTGEGPPAPEGWAAPIQQYQTPQATVDAFWHVMRLDDPNYLGRWLNNHPLDAPHLHKIWGAKCSTAAA
jgi:hypothetical protein